MTIEVGTKVDLSYVLETTRGTTPNSPSMKTLRATSRNVNPQKDLLRSAEVRADRMVRDVRHGYKRVIGSVGFQFGLTDFDDMILMAMADDAWTDVSTGSVSLSTSGSAAASGSTPSTTTVGRSTGSFVTDGFDVGDIVTLTGFATADNNGRARVTSVAALALGLSKLDTDTDFADDTAAASREVDAGGKVKVGTTLKTMTLERRFTGISQYQDFLGVAINQLNVAINPTDIAVATADLIGMSGGGFSGTSLGTPAADSGEQPFSAFDGAISIDGVDIAVITGLTFSINNQRSGVAVVGQDTTPDIFEGQGIVSGQVRALFDGPTTLFNKFYDEQAAAIAVRLDDIGLVDCHNIRMGNVKFNTGDMDPPQVGPVELQASFEALYDSASGTTISWQRSA